MVIIEDDNHIVTVPYNTYGVCYDMTHWAIKNCPSYIRYKFQRKGWDIVRPVKVDYIFAKESDAVLFALRWL